MGRFPSPFGVANTHNVRRRTVSVGPYALKQKPDRIGHRVSETFLAKETKVSTITAAAPTIRFSASTNGAMDIAQLVEYFDMAGRADELDQSYRYVVEAVSNVYEHARAPSGPNIEWSLIANQTAAGFEIEIRDWGRGVFCSIAERGFAVSSDRDAVSLALSGCGQSRSGRGLGLSQILRAVNDSKLMSFRVASGQCAFDKHGRHEAYRTLPKFVPGTVLTFLLPQVGGER